MSRFVSSLLFRSLEEFERPKRTVEEQIFCYCRLALVVETVHELYFPDLFSEFRLSRFLFLGKYLVESRALFLDSVFHSFAMEYFSLAGVLSERFSSVIGVDDDLLEEIFSIRVDGMLGVGVSLAEMKKLRRVL